ncbi:Hypothetical protein AA314_06308 [Archangium gephyra]|uniref:Uncharacterized protein n=1 Tax=Archangium gephyra TaxID=48 RepID=A0AAC8TG24_9BACT|nr:Hypothetical protein AA314_06308 [Archangium gephyra]
MEDVELCVATSCPLPKATGMPAAIRQRSSVKAGGCIASPSCLGRNPVVFTGPGLEVFSGPT